MSQDAIDAMKLAGDMRQHDIEESAAIDLVAECLSPLPADKDTRREWAWRTNRLLCAILLRLT